MSLERKTIDSIDYEVERAASQDNNIEYAACVRTRVPSKWRLIDLETGEVYGFRQVGASRDNSGLSWKKVNDIEFKVVGRG